MNKPLRPRDRSIDVRMRVLGVLGFLLLAGVFFTVGVFCLGPWLRSAQRDAPPADEAPSYEQRSQRPIAEAEPQEQKGPDIKLEVTEAAEGAGIPAADEPSEEGQPEGDPDVRIDDKAVTVTLDGKDRKRPPEKEAVPAPAGPKQTAPAAEPKPAAKPADSGRPAQTTSGSSSLEKPRAATEKRVKVYQVQAGSYANRSSADSLAAKLKKEGYRRTVVLTSPEKDRTLYRVQVAEYKTREDAQELANDLKATGYGPAVIERSK